MRFIAIASRFVYRGKVPTLTGYGYSLTRNSQTNNHRNNILTNNNCFEITFLSYLNIVGCYFWKKTTARKERGNDNM